jgi:UDP-N-acetylmuramoylalanine--D-glutamate ligase
VSGTFAGERAVVLGAGVAGCSAAEVLAAEGATVRVSEARPRSALGRTPSVLEEAGIDLLDGGHRPEHLDGATIVLASPGIPPSTDVLGWVADRGLTVWGELELGARLVRCPTIGVTGTNGKTTVTSMIEACLRAAGLDAVACGNIGNPFPAVAREDHDVLVVEASSFQLAEQESFHPRVSVLLNLAPDHLDWHGSFEAYAEAKDRIFARQETGDLHVGNRDDPEAAVRSARAPCETVWFRTGEPLEGEVGYIGEDLVSGIAGREGTVGPIDQVRTGYRANAAAAAAASLAFGVDLVAVGPGLEGFVPAGHRGDLVAVLEGLRFVEDSKATNVHAALAALTSVEDAVLIAGGRAKGVDLSPLATMADRLVGVVAIGEAAPALVEVFEGRVPVATADSIEEAVERAAEIARRPGTVLLAPACASWDQFADYVERGERFAAAARALPGAIAVGNASANPGAEAEATHGAA